MAKLIRLRDVAGMRRILELSLNPRQHDPNMRTQLDEEADALSIKLFGITKWHTYFEDDDSEYSEDNDSEEVEEDDDDVEPDLSDAESQRVDEYLASLSVCDLPFEAARPVWEALGWDISDGNDNEMLSANLFLRQILVVESGIIQGAKFHPNGDGKPLFDWEGIPIEESMSFEEKLQAEAENFLIGRTG